MKIFPLVTSKHIAVLLFGTILKQVMFCVGMFDKQISEKSAAMNVSLGNHFPQ